jgi:hypothetical protein
MLSERKPLGAAILSILNEKRFDPARHDADPEPRHLVVENKLVDGSRT